MTTRPGCESGCPHPAAGAQSSRAGREAAGGGRTPRARVPRNRVTSAGLGRAELAATLLTPQRQVSGEVVRAAAPAVPSPAGSRPPGLRWSGPVPPAAEDRRSRGDGCGGGLWRQRPPERLWLGRWAHGRALPRGISYPSSCARSGEAGLYSLGRAASPATAGGFAPKGSRRAHLPFEYTDAGCDASVPLFPCTHVGRQALLSQSQHLTEGQHWSCAPATASPSAYLPVSAEVPISGAAQHPQHPHRKINTSV